MAPELQVLAINAVGLAVAYLGIFPSLRPLTRTRLAVAELVMCAIVLTTVGALFWGTDETFALGFFDVGWFVFGLVTLVAMEMPLLWWFTRRHGIDLTGDKD